MSALYAWTLLIGGLGLAFGAIALGGFLLALPVFLFCGKLPDRHD